MDWKETFEDLWWGSFDNNGEKNSHEYEKMVSFIENLLEQERKRILSLPCMEREEAPEEVHDLDNQLELIQGLANFNWNSGRNFLRRELKEAIINK